MSVFMYIKNMIIIKIRYTIQRHLQTTESIFINGFVFNITQMRLSSINRLTKSKM